MESFTRVSVDVNPWSWVVVLFLDVVVGDGDLGANALVDDERRRSGMRAADLNDIIVLLQ
jgi:hypothetical protein